MKICHLPNQRILYDKELISESVESCFDVKYWHSQDRVIGSAQGRGTTWFVEMTTLPAALRHYYRGGLFGKLIKDHYWFCGWSNTRSFQEFNLLHELHKLGVHVPRPIAARSVKRMFCYKADILTEKINNARDLVDILQVSTLASDIYLQIGMEVRKLHDANVNHTDLNIHNILLDVNNKVWIIDFDKCYKNDSLNKTWKKSNLERLERSFHKELKKSNIFWKEDSDWAAFKAGYNQ